MQYAAYNETVTTVSSEKVEVKAVLFDNDEKLPKIYDAQVLNVATELNGVSGEEEELIVSSTDSNPRSFQINTTGEGLVDTHDDDSSRYSQNSGGQLIYEN